MDWSRTEVKGSLEYGLLFAIGTFGYFAQVFMTKSLQVEAANRVVPIKYMEVVYSLLIGLIWFDEGYTLIGLTGIIIIIISMLMSIKTSKKTQDI